MCKIYKKLEDLSKILEDFLQNQYTSHQNIVYIDVWKGRSPLQPPDSGVSRYRLGAKPLVATNNAW